MGTKILTRELDDRMRSVEEKLAELAERIAQIDDQMRRNHPVELVNEVSPATNGHSSNGIGATYEARGGDGKLAEIEAQIVRLDDRIQKIASTIIAQSSRL